jgi:hypothetical protein
LLGLLFANFEKNSQKKRMIAREKSGCWGGSAPLGNSNSVLTKIKVICKNGIPFIYNKNKQTLLFTVH